MLLLVEFEVLPAVGFRPLTLLLGDVTTGFGVATTGTGAGVTTGAGGCVSVGVGAVFGVGVTGAGVELFGTVVAMVT